MRKKVKSDLIDGFTYEVTQLGAVDGRRLLVQLSKIILPTLGALIKGSGLTKVADMDLSAVDLDAAAKALVGAADVDVVDRVIDTMSGATEVWGPGYGDSGAPLSRSFDDHFAGRYASMLRWLAFALKANFADFFDGKGNVEKLADSLRSPEVASKSLSI